ncbi:MAG: fosfomycin resistance protein FosB [Bryobacterales bacterium]|jgi:catechol 2,3-dioxygenase-like lactoylglutathione lyase family enzyme|nr:fosfomycin resistance protein FosB [Bryobacterales bacterium]
MPEIHSIVETALYVADLNRAERFYERVLGLRRIYCEEGRLHALAIAAGHVLLLFRIGASTQPTDSPGGRIPAHDGQGQLHLAFGIHRDDLPAWRMRLNAAGVEIESEVDTPLGGKSLYFRDPDRHCIELVTPGTWSVY